MAELPAERVNISPPFSYTGIDFAGPLKIKTSMLTRAKGVAKAYLCLFVCFCTKAVHVEIVSSLSTEAFLAALSRFTSRRGKPSVIYSDNGSNFVGAANEINELVKVMKSSQVNNFISNNEIQWKFIPPGAPNFGGLWEAGIKSVKKHLKRVVGENNLTFEELYTIVTKIESILNSRPITPVSNDPNDFCALTPGHFLIGRPLTSVPEEAENGNDLQIGYVKRWKMVRQLQQTFWNVWRNDYLNSLQVRHKWTQKMKNLEIGDMVILKQDNIPPGQWLLGRIINVIFGNDGLTRVVDVKTKNGVYRRALNKIILLRNV